MPNDKVKFYKNSERNKPEIRKSYVPQYQIMGVEPEEFSSSASKDVVPAQKVANTNSGRPTRKMMQPYANVVPSPIGRGRGLVPNVGNNMEHTWSSVDGEIVNDISDDFSIVDSNHEMIDNNEVVTSQALGVDDNVLEQTEIVSVSDSSLPEEGYSLFVLEHFLDAGTLEKIQDQVRLLVFGEHPKYKNKTIPVENISVFRVERVKIKIGVFLE